MSCGSSGACRWRPTRTAAQAMLNDLICKVERIKAGLIDPGDEQRKRPMREHLADFKRYLTNKGITTKQVTESTKRIQKIVDSRKLKLLSDLSADAVVEFLSELRREGQSAQTRNNYLVSVKQFSRWLVRDRRIGFDPLAHISGQNVRTDRRHDRRALSNDEFNRLIQAARSGKTIEAIAGPDRAMLYVLAAWTGFRKGELGSLTPRSFRLDDEPATATVAACYSKRRRQDSQVLHPAVVGQLKEWLATKPKLQPGDLLFPVSGRVPGGTERKTNKMMRRDFQAARKKWIKRRKNNLKRWPAVKSRTSCRTKAKLACSPTFIPTGTCLSPAWSGPAFRPRWPRRLHAIATFALRWASIRTLACMIRRRRSNRCRPHPRLTGAVLKRLRYGQPGPMGRWTRPQRRAAWCFLWCPAVLKTVPFASHRGRTYSHRIAPTTRARGAKLAIRRSS